MSVEDVRNEVAKKEQGIKEIIKDTVDIQKIVKPVYNFKAK